MLRCAMPETIGVGLRTKPAPRWAKTIARAPVQAFPLVGCKKMAGNSFGTLFRFTTWGETQGPAIGVVVDGVPPRLPLAEPDIQQWLDKRRPGQSRYTTQRQEPDQVKILSGTFNGETTGTPLSLVIDNVDQRSKDYRNIADR